MSIDFSTLDQQRLLAERVKRALTQIEDKTDLLSVITTALDTYIDGVNDKVDDLSIPTKTSELTNDAKFQTDTDVANAIANSDKLTRRKIDSLSDIDPAADDAEDFIYMLGVTDTDGNTYYQQYMVINGAVEAMGTTKVDFEGYLTEEDVATDEEVDAEIESGDVPLGLSASSIEFLKDIFLSGFVPYGKELTDPWPVLQYRIKAGDFKGIHIGDYKTITLNDGEVVVMEVAGIDQYYRCGYPTVIGHHVDFISRDCLAGTKVFNDTDTNNGTAAEPNPWVASKLFRTLNDATTGVYAKLPADLKACIIEKIALLENRYSNAGALGNDISWHWDAMGKLWLPTEVEVFGNTFWSDGDAGFTGGAGCNLQYPIFQGGAKHIIKGAGNGGGRCYWWEALALRQSSTNVCVVASDGTAGYYVATKPSVYAPLCFRVD